MSRTLSALRAKAQGDRKHRFRALSRLLDRQMLAEAFARLKRRAAPGIDGVSYVEYAKDLEARLEDLESRLKAGRYRAQNLRRRWIAKAGGRKRRPLAIPALEDKIVQQAVRMILEAIWEPDFVEESIGYRPGKGGRVLFRRYADDSVVCFEREDDARAYLRVLPKRLEKFGLQMAQEKSALVKFNRWEPDDSGKFSFLGFDFYWARTRRNPNHVVVKRRTNRAKFRASLRAMKDWIKSARSWRLRGAPGNRRPYLDRQIR